MAEEYKLEEDKTGRGYSCRTARKDTHRAWSCGGRRYRLAEDYGKVETGQVDVQEKVVGFFGFSLWSCSIVSDGSAISDWNRLSR